jgi:hypothetical protein
MGRTAKVWGGLGAGRGAHIPSAPVLVEDVGIAAHAFGLKRAPGIARANDHVGARLHHPRVPPAALSFARADHLATPLHSVELAHAQQAAAWTPRVVAVIPRDWTERTQRRRQLFCRHILPLPFCRVLTTTGDHAKEVGTQGSMAAEVCAETLVDARRSECAHKSRKAHRNPQVPR